MTRLTFHFSTPRDLLAKLGRDFVRLNEAVESGDKERIADCIFDFANTGYSIKEWLKADAPDNDAKNDVEQHVNDNPALSACRDVCNSNKHYTITHYIPLAQDVYASATGTGTIAAPLSISGVGIETDPAPAFRVKVLLSTGAKYEVMQFAESVLEAWQAFFSDPKT